MAKQTIKSLQTELATVRTRSTENYENGAKWRAKAEEAEASLKESREHFADLKRALSNAEAETSRLRGYLDRVHEDDIVRDGMVEIEDENGKRMVPKRPPPMRSMEVKSRSPDTFTVYDQLSGRQKKRTHWTSY